MPSIAESIRRLQRIDLTAPLAQATTGGGRLLPLRDFGSNPGSLDGWYVAPDDGRQMALVLVLHGCTQTAAGYDAGSGWSELAERHGFAVLFAEQNRQNNPNLCFNWFNPEDTRRGGGEAESIRQMIRAMTDRHPIDPARIFVTGLSAGGAMTSVMLAAYPEVFAGGGIIAGLPYGAATSVPEALQRMRGQGHPPAGVYASRLRAACPHASSWPTISVWHGDADQTVSPDNADRIVEQWREVHGVARMPDRSEIVDGHRRQVWLDRDGREVIETYRIAGLGHGTPLKAGGPDGCGRAGPHMLEAGISSTRHLAARWGILDEERAMRRPARSAEECVEPVAGNGRPIDAAATPSTVGDTINAALRSAGLLK